MKTLKQILNRVIKISGIQKQILLIKNEIFLHESEKTVVESILNRTGTGGYIRISEIEILFPGILSEERYSGLQIDRRNDPPNSFDDLLRLERAGYDDAENEYIGNIYDSLKDRFQDRISQIESLLINLNEYLEKFKLNETINDIGRNSSHITTIPQKNEPNDNSNDNIYINHEKKTNNEFVDKINNKYSWLKNQREFAYILRLIREDDKIIKKDTSYYEISKKICTIFRIGSKDINPDAFRTAIGAYNFQEEEYENEFDFDVPLAKRHIESLIQDISFKSKKKKIAIF